MRHPLRCGIVGDPVMGSWSSFINRTHPFPSMHCCKILLDRSKNFEEHPCHSFLPMEFGADGTNIRILTCSMIDSTTGYSMIDIRDDSDSLEEGHHPSENGDCNITRLGTNHYLAMVTNRRCFLSKLINESGCFLVSAEPDTDTLIRWTLIGPNSTVLHNLLSRMRESGYCYQMVSSSSVSMSSTLTSRQEECFNLAMDLGYYDVPKRIGLDELCKISGCSKSTLNVTLRSAEKRIFEFYRMFCVSNRFYKN